MKRLYPSIFLASIAVFAIAATVKISDLTLSTSPSTNTFIEIADMNAATKSGKYLLTNLVTQASFTAATNTLTTSAANWTASGTTNSTLTGTARANNAVLTNGLTAGASTFTDAVTVSKAYRQYQGTLTHAGTVTLDFDATTTLNYISLTGNITLATSNLATNRTYFLRVQNTQATNCSFTLPAWIPIGSALPVSIAAGKTAHMQLISWGVADTNVDCIFAAQP